MDAATQARWDHARDLLKHEISPRHQKRAVIELVGYCWGLTHGGLLSLEIEKQLRSRIRTVCVEFGMDPPADPVPVRTSFVLDGSCLTCARLAKGEFAPPHDASPRCESGKRNHCTCDVCF